MRAKRSNGPTSTRSLPIPSPWDGTGESYPPSPNVTVDADGARHATLTSTSDSAHSGFIQGAPQDRIGLPQSALGATRFRVTFTQPGSHPYICALHDGLGMKGRVPGWIE